MPERVDSVTCRALSGQATAVGGVVTVRPARPAKARYLLLWFTRLPPDPSGNFEAIIFSVRLHGIA